jgi:hypothetical protein
LGSRPALIGTGTLGLLWLAFVVAVLSDDDYT